MLVIPKNTAVKSCSLLYIFLLLESARCIQWLDEVLEFLDENGLKYATFVVNSTEHSPYMKEILLKAYKTSELYLRHSKLQDYTEHHTFHVDAQIFLFDSDYDDIGSFLKVIQKMKVRRSILLAIKPWRGRQESVFQNELKETPNLLFYLASPSHELTMMLWKQVITLSSGYAINELKFKECSYTVIEDFDLNGLKLTSISPPWPPFLYMDECDEEGAKCTVQYGYLVDYMDALAQALNFTYESFREPG